MRLGIQQEDITNGKYETNHRAREREEQYTD